MIPRNDYPKRFISAVDKLITAYVKDELDALNPCACAVGNICNNNYEWRRFNPTSMLNRFGGSEKQKGLELIKETGYSVKEILKVEDIFMNEASFTRAAFPSNFDGLVAVFEYLAKLDNIDLDQTEIFKDALKNKEELCLTN